MVYPSPALFSTMFLGEYNAPLGDKNRIALPKRIREQLEAQIIVARGYENCILLVDKNRWDGLIAEVNRRPLLNLNVRDTKRFLLGGAYEVNLDNQGRFVIPEGLLTYASIGTQVVFIGVGEWVEIWDELRWKKKLTYLAENSADIADRL